MKDKTPLWKWGLLVIAGTVMFLLLYQIAPAIGSLSNSFWIKLVLLLSGGICLLGLYAVCIKLFEKRKVHELNIRRAFPDLLTGFAIGTLFIAGVVLILAAAGVYRIGSVSGNWEMMLLNFAALSIVAAGEEVIFRGIIFRMIRDRFNVTAAFIISSLLFGLAHLQTVDLWTAAAIAAEGGFMLAAAYNLRNNLWVPTGIHWAWNYMSGPVFGLNVSGMEQEYSLIVPEIGGPYILSGGSNGFEGSVITCICGVLIGIILLHYGKKPGIFSEKR